MRVSVPVLAPLTPPVTGASRQITSLASPSAARSIASSGLEVVRSISTWPGFAARQQAVCAPINCCHVVGAADHGEGDFRRLGDRGGGGQHFRTACAKIRDLVRPPGVEHQIVAGALEVRRHRATHHAEADEPHSHVAPRPLESVPPAGYDSAPQGSRP